MGCCSSSTAVRVIATECRNHKTEELEGNIVIIIIILTININKDDDESPNSTVYIERILHITADIHETYRSRSAFGETEGKRDEVFFAFNIIAMVVVTAIG